jgi:hexokinase
MAPRPVLKLATPADEERKPPSRKGSMALVPKDLLEQIADLERLFTVPTEKLITITDRFVDELEKGLSKEGGSIVCPCLRY